MKQGFTRRSFLQKQAAAMVATAAIPSIIPSSVLGQAAPSNRIVVGAIGVGPQGRGVMSGFLAQSDVQVVMLCDMAKPNLEQAVNQVNQRYKNNDVKTCGDFRELLSRKDIDAVLIATPDHWHVPTAIAAAKAGKDMYVEKPLGLSVEEDQLLRKICQEKQRIFQFGTQQRSDREFRRACEFVRNGKIGKLKQINVWCVGSRPGGSTQPSPVPEGLAYDLWLGPAPKTPYTLGKCFDEQGAWKTWWYNYDYALGFIAGWGVHPLDIAYWGHPEMMQGAMEIEGKGIIPKEGACNTSIAWDVKFTFGNGVRMHYKATPGPGVTKNEYNDFTEWKSRYGKIADHGTAFEGTDGWIEVHRGGLQTSPESLAEQQLGPNDKPLTKVTGGHQRNFVDSVKSRKPAICPIEDAVQADVLCHLSDIATRLDRKLKWDPAQERFVNDPEANRKLALRPMRSPWQLG